MMRILDENLLANLALNPIAIAEFPFLRGAFKTVEERCCGGSIRRRTMPDYPQMKAAVAALEPARQRRFLELAGLPKMRVVWRDGNKVRDAVMRRE